MPASPLAWLPLWLPASPLPWPLAWLPLSLQVWLLPWLPVWRRLFSLPAWLLASLQPWRQVSLRREQARIEVAEGSVQVRGDSGQGRLLADLRAGQSAHIDYRDQTVSLRQQHADTMTAWWRRRVVFQDEPLREVAEQFNRLNDVRLQVDDDLAGALRLTGNLRGDDLASLRTFLDQQPTLRTEVVDKQIRVSSRPAVGISAKPR